MQPAFIFVYQISIYEVSILQQGEESGPSFLHMTHVSSHSAHRVAAVLSGETDRGLCGQSCLNSETLDQSSPLSLSPPFVFLIAHSSSLHSDGGHVWSRAENGQSGSSHIHTVITAAHISLSLCRLHTVQTYYPAHSDFISHL